MHWTETEPFVGRAFELAAANPSRVVVLGGGAAFGLANEAVLQTTFYVPLGAGEITPPEEPEAEKPSPQQKPGRPQNR